MLFSAVDFVALFWFLAAWIGYSFVIELTPRGRTGLNALMHRYRGLWMERMLARDPRMMDGQVIGALQNGTAFFASTSSDRARWRGDAVSLHRGHADNHRRAAVRRGHHACAVGNESRRADDHLHLRLLQVRVVVPALQLLAIMLGAAPPAAEQDTPEAKSHAAATATMITDAGRHFNRGQRAFFFALGYLGWFLGPLPLIATTAGVLVVMWRRQFASDSRAAIRGA